MELLFDRVVGGRRIIATATQRRDGDVHPRRVSPAVLSARQHAIAGGRWVMVDQVHGTDVVVLGDEHRDAPAAWPFAGRGDVIVAARPDQALAVWAADCAAVALFGANGSIVMFHAGWRGIAAGIVDVALGAVASCDDHVDAVVVGPVIHPCCYAFGDADLAIVAAGVRTTTADIAGLTTAGDVALDVPAALSATLRRHGLAIDVLGSCTGCSTKWFSHRARAEPDRHTLVVQAVGMPADVAR